MESNIDKIIEIYKSLAKCTKPEELRCLKGNLEGALSGQSGAQEEFSLKKGETSWSEIDQLGRNLDNMVDGVKELIDRGRFCDDLTIGAPEENAVKLPAPELVGEMFQRNMNEIWACLMGNEVSTIGVLGMGGVGKTTLIKHVHNKSLEIPHIFDFVCWVTVSKDCNTRNLQRQIANQLGVDISSEDDISRRAGLLAWTLERKNRFVLFLDDIWEHFDIENAVGIPKKNGCKLILTTRLKAVCSKMSCDKTIKVDPLLEEEAWTLFVKYVGQKIPHNLVDLANLVSKECAGLPIAIITLASSMRDNFKAYEWRSVLKKLRDSKSDVEDMESNVFKVLRLSYERLNDSKAQNCLLYCSTYPEDNDVAKEDLIWRCIDMGLFDELETISIKIDQVLCIFDKLERACLLSVSEDGSTVKMHDLIRDMTLQIAGSRFVVKSYLAGDDFRNEKKWSTDGLVVSVFTFVHDLCDDDVSCSDFMIKIIRLTCTFCEGVTHISPKWPKLTTLILQLVQCRSVADCFFDHICGLQVLTLSGSDIDVLPKSISHLRNLTSLSLRNCVSLKYVPSLTELKALERLDLFRAGIEDAPKGLKKLINLRYLNLGMTKLKSVPMKDIGALTNLEYLNIRGFKVTIHEIIGLKKIEILEADFGYVCDFNEYVRHIKLHVQLNTYRISVGGRDTPILAYLSDHLWGKSVTISGINMIDERGDIMELPNDITFLRIYKCVNIRFLFDVIPSPLNGLEELFLDTLKDFWCLSRRESFVSRSVDYYCSLSQLKHFKMMYCDKIKKLFTLGMLSHLQNLETLFIGFCSQLDSIVAVSSVEEEIGKVVTSSSALPKLRKLTLTGLPNLKSICSSTGLIISCVSLETISIWGCPRLRRISLSPLSSLPIFQFSKQEEEWWEALEWDLPNTKTTLQPVPVVGLNYIEVIADAVDSRAVFMMRNLEPILRKMSLLPTD